ncbi:hypothetical protein F5Y12DRAFT_717484 [Xylaria sp. FL1777]|nr:hypothetical protein F5Y12DRAFT_717484 [Xylaria sp. FL1777]
MEDQNARWWLPGPPPPRRLIPLNPVKEENVNYGMNIPIHHMRISLSNLGETLDLYAKQLDKTASASGTKPVFHGCGTSITPEVIASFAQRGPSIQYSRGRGYFSTNPAVYWSSTLRFAVGWCFFTQTGSWELKSEAKGKPRSFLIYVSLVDFASTPFEGGLYMVVKPQTRRDEDELSNWCTSNMVATQDGNTGKRLPPPGSTRSDWGVIGSRIPLETWRSLKAFERCIDQVWMYAACSEMNSRFMAEAGVEILLLTVQ